MKTIGDKSTDPEIQAIAETSLRIGDDAASAPSSESGYMAS